MRFPTLLITTLSLCLLAGPPALAEPAGPHISVTGEGRADLAPDMAVISFGVTTEAETAGAALAANTEEMARVMDYLRDTGIEDRDIQTSGLSLNPRFDDQAPPRFGSPQITGFHATNIVTVRVRALGDLGALLDAVVSEGANTFHGLSFGLQDPRAAQDTARNRAVADARRRAELLAAAAGVKVGAVHAIIDTQGAGGPVAMYHDQEFRRGSSVPVAGGEVSVAANVTVVFALTQ